MRSRIKTRLLIAYLSVSGILLISGSIGLYSRNLIENDLKSLAVDIVKVDAMHRLALQLERVLMPANDYLISGDISENERFRQRRSELNQIMAQVKALHPEHVEVFQQVSKQLTKIDEKAAQIFSIPPRSLLNQSNLRKSGTALMYEMDMAGEKAYRILSQETEADRGNLQSTIITANKTLLFINHSLFGGAIAVFIIGLFFVIYIERNIRKPLEKLSRGVQGVASGQWSEIELNDGSEISVLAGEFNQMVGKLHTAHNELESRVRQRTSELKEANEKLKNMAITDGLTELYNHRQFYYILGEEIERAKQNGHYVSLLMLDIDNFKTINDSYGHLVGDCVLKGIAEVIKLSSRNSDTVARYGGEEFSIILPQMGKGDASRFGERIRHEIEKKYFSCNVAGQVENILTTVSIGVSTFPVDTENIDETIYRADNALYRAKNDGKNRVATC